MVKDKDTKSTLGPKDTVMMGDELLQALPSIREPVCDVAWVRVMDSEGIAALLLTQAEISFKAGYERAMDTQLKADKETQTGGKRYG